MPPWIIYRLTTRSSRQQVFGFSPSVIINIAFSAHLLCCRQFSSPGRHSLCLRQLLTPWQVVPSPLPPLPLLVQPAAPLTAAQVVN